MNQVNLQGDSSVILAQLKDPDIQRMIHIIRGGTLLPNHGNFANRLFQKLFKNRNRLEVNHDVLYWKYFDHTGKVTSKQIVVSDNTVDGVFRTLHDNFMQGHPGASKMLKEIRKRFYAPISAPKV